MNTHKTSCYPDIILFTLSRWDNPYSSTALSLAKEFSKQARVFYVDNPFTLKDLLFGFLKMNVKRKRRSPIFRKHAYNSVGENNPNLIAFTLPPVLPMNFLPDGRFYKLLSVINDRVLFSSIKKMMAKFNIKDFIFVNIFNPFYCLQFPDFFKPRLFIYYTMDNIAHSLYVQKHGVRLETEAMQKACFTLATSRELETIASAKSKHVYYLPNGVDHSIFLCKSENELSKPREFVNIHVPIILFMGNCDHRLDMELIKMMLNAHQDKILVLVGPLSMRSEVADELRAYPNLEMTGKKSPAEIPRYLSHAQCLVIPYVCNTLTKSIYPLKLNEYLASGTPVVSTPFSEDVRGFRNVILLSDSKEDFCDKISLAIENDNDEKRKLRKLTAAGNKWENRAGEFWKLVNRHLN